VEVKLREGMARQGITGDAAEQIVRSITAFALYGFPECVVGDTRVIDAETGCWKRIEDVVEGRVSLPTTLACDESLKLQRRCVMQATRSGAREVYRLRTAQGREVTATAEHPVLTTAGWRALGSVRPGDQIAAAQTDVASIDLEYSAVEWDQVEAVDPAGFQETYDLEVEGDHNFLANDLVVHNSHSSSFALLAYASAYLKAHHPAEFYAALLNNQPMGFYHSATIVKDAQRHGVRVLPVDVTRSEWLTRPLETKTIRLGLMCVKGLREHAGRGLVAARAARPFISPIDAGRRAELDREEMATLAAIGAFAALGESRRAALWTVARADPGPLFSTVDATSSPLAEMTTDERANADYAGTGVTVGPHPMALRRGEMIALGVTRAVDLQHAVNESRVRVAGSVIVRQRPGTAKGFVFLSLEDETGITNVIVTPQLFARARLTLVSEPFLLVEGTLQLQDDVVSVRARRVHALARTPHHVPSHDFG
jgi:error-prone DNA polymerase